MLDIDVCLVWKDMRTPRHFDGGLGNDGFFIHDRGDFVVGEAGSVGAGLCVELAISVVCLGEYTGMNSRCWYKDWKHRLNSRVVVG